MSDEIDVSETMRELTVRLESGRPVASTIKRVIGGVAFEEPRIRISAENQAILNGAWAKRVAAYRDLNDNEDRNLVVPLKNAYFKSIEEYKILYKRLVGE